MENRFWKGKKQTVFVLSKAFFSGLLYCGEAFLSSSGSPSRNITKSSLLLCNHQSGRGKKKNYRKTKILVLLSFWIVHKGETQHFLTCVALACAVECGASHVACRLHIESFSSWFMSQFLSFVLESDSPCWSCWWIWSLVFFLFRHFPRLLSKLTANRDERRGCGQCSSLSKPQKLWCFLPFNSQLKFRGKNCLRIRFCNPTFPSGQRALTTNQNVVPASFFHFALKRLKKCAEMKANAWAKIKTSNIRESKASPAEFNKPFMSIDGRSRSICQSTQESILPSLVMSKWKKFAFSLFKINHHGKQMGYENTILSTANVAEWDDSQAFW